MASRVNASIKLDFGALDDLKKAIGKRYYTKVGLLGDHAAREHGEEIGNPELGAVQEFGTLDGKIPARSWLRFPLEFKMKDMVAYLTSKPIAADLARGDIKRVMKLWGIKAQEIIDEAFETGGFGTWKENAPSTIAAKGSSAPLIEWSEMRRAVSSKVIEK